jgi:chromosome segregation ATPase
MPPSGPGPRARRAARCRTARARAALEQDITRIEASLGAERERRDAIEAEFAPQVEVLTRDLAAARARVGDEVLGRDGRPEGYGPEARKWDARAELLEQQLGEIQAQRDARLSGIVSTIDDLNRRLGERTDALQSVREEQAALVAEISREVEAEQPPALPPKLTFAAQSKGLSALRDSPSEAGVPHFETVEGFAQAALGILFFALLALKLFEPAAVHAYYSEAVQLAYRRYLQGGLDHIPGFGQYDDPIRRLAPVDFAHLWERWRRDPNGFAERHRRVQTAEARLHRVTAEINYETELIRRRNEDIDARLALDRRRQEAELRAHEQRLDLELSEARRRLTGETDLELARLEQQRDEARKAHELAVAGLRQHFDAERRELEDELEQKRSVWQREREEAEAELAQRVQAFDANERREREQARLRQLALDDRRRLRERTLAQRAETANAQSAAADRELRIRETRARLEQEREDESRLREQLTDLTAKRSERTDRATAAAAELDGIRLRRTELAERISDLRTRFGAALETPPAPISFGGGEDARRLRRAIKELDQLGRSDERLREREGALTAEQQGAERAAADLDAAIGGLTGDLEATSSRIAQYRDTLDRLLMTRG